MSQASDQSLAPIVLVDGSSYLFRAYHALPPLMNKQGMATGAAKGVINMMRSLLLNYPQSPVIVVFDAKGDTFRNEIYDQYKANRPPMPDDLREQIEPIHQMIKAMGLPLIMESGVEADDVIGTLALECTNLGRDCVISTGDKDMAQLVTEHVTLLNTMKNELLDVDGVKEKYGFGPEYMIDYLGLMGDKVDNIPGVPGVGDKTATGLIQGLGSIKNIYENLDKVKDLAFRGAKTMAKKLEANQELAELSYVLATIKCDVKLEKNVLEFTHQPQDDAALLALFQQMEFKGWIKSLSEQMQANGQTVEIASEDIAITRGQIHDSEMVEVLLEHCETVHYEQIKDMQKLADVLYNIKQHKKMAVDFVFSKAHYLNNHLLAISLSSEAGTAFTICFDHELYKDELLIEQEVIEQLKPLFERYDIKKTVADLKQTLHYLSRQNIKPSNIANDISIQSFVFNSTIKRDKSLDKHFSVLSVDNLIRVYGSNIEESYFPKTYAEIAGKFGKKQLTWSQLEFDVMVDYLSARADYILRLGEFFETQLKQTGELFNVYQSIELPLVPALAQIEQNGAYLDVNLVNQLTHDFTTRMKEYELRAFELAGSEFNIDSPKQIGEVLFEKLEIPVIKKTPTGQPSTAEEVLVELSKEYELPDLILKYRHLKKLVSTYTQSLPLMVDTKTQMIHTSYHQNGAQTGRLSSTEPNLQNIPIRSEEGRAIRKAFCARPGYKIVAADYSQIELRIMTHLCADTNLLYAFNNGLDVHKSTAAEVFGVPLDEVTNDQRRSAKAINFGLIYGMSAFGLAAQLDISRSDAKVYVESYFEKYPEVKRYMDQTKMQANEDGFVETIMGRRLYLPDINSNKGMLKAAAERTAINAPMQGSAADIIKLAMNDVQYWLKKEDIQANLIMQVHDELVFEVKEEELDRLISGVKIRMQSAASLSVPLIVDVGVGDNWDEAH
ncbi:DNA polymerase I [Marinicellulosiphila megalodicopiae]|uniref:DNA polymerase I n=1 Tax=Marinicellulosiphila megalodicopiae TaxID=2724896 RepID=UPI003BAF75A7